MTITQQRRTALEIFNTTQPSDPGTIQIDLPLGAAERILTEITLEGIRIKYPEKSIFDLTRNELTLIKRYIESCGYRLHIYANKTNRDFQQFDKLEVTSIQMRFINIDSRIMP